MNEAVEVPCRFFDGFTHLIVAVEIKNVGNEVERILVVLHFRVQAGQVEAVCEVVFVNLTKVFVASRGYELDAESRSQQEKAVLAQHSSRESVRDQRGTESEEGGAKKQRKQRKLPDATQTQSRQ